MNEKLNWFRNCVEHKLVNFKVGGVQERIGYELQNWVLVILKVSLRCKTCSYIYIYIYISHYNSPIFMFTHHQNRKVDSLLKD